MLNHLFKPSVSRSEHDRIVKTYNDILSTTIEQRDDAYEALAEAEAEHTKAVDRELKATTERDAAKKQAYASECDRHAADKERDEAQELTVRALILLQGVDTSRTGGKQLREARERLFADAMLAGLWGEEK